MSSVGESSILPSMPQVSSASCGKKTRFSMKAEAKDITPGAFLAAYDALVQAGGGNALEGDLARLQEDFQRRTGTFRQDDPAAEVDARSRAFWDDALTQPGFAARAAAELAPGARPERLDEVVGGLGRAHRGLFVVEEASRTEALLVDLWSGAELVVRVLDEAQALALEHAEGAVDGRVVPVARTLFLLPGAFHHPADATPHFAAVLDAARERTMGTAALLDALLRMERVLRTSSRVKAAYAYRTSGLVRAAVPPAPPSRPSSRSLATQAVSPSTDDDRGAR